MEAKMARIVHLSGRTATYNAGEGSTETAFATFDGEAEFPGERGVLQLCLALWPGQGNRMMRVLLALTMVVAVTVGWDAWHAPDGPESAITLATYAAVLLGEFNWSFTMMLFPSGANADVLRLGVGTSLVLVALAAYRLQSGSGARSKGVHGPVRFNRRPGKSASIGGCGQPQTCGGPPSCEDCLLFAVRSGDSIAAQSHSTVIQKRHATVGLSDKSNEQCVRSVEMPRTSRVAIAGLMAAGMAAVGMAAVGLTATKANGAAPEQSASSQVAAGEELFAQRCQGCHELATVTARRGSPQEWQEIVDRMILNGAQLTDSEKGAIIKYLATAYGPKPAGTPNG